MKTQIVKIILLLMIASTVLFTISCDTTESNDTSLALSFATEAALPKLSDENIQIQEVKLQLKEIKIKNQADENEMQVKTGPMVISLNFDGSPKEFASSEIPAGNYDRIRFEIHKMQETEETIDPEFAEENDNSKRYSTVVKGLMGGEPFTYRFSKSAVQDIKLDEDLVVNEGDATNLTIKVDPYSWFYEGDLFLNPNDQANESKIENNMKNAFKRAFKDNNQDGVND